MQQRMRNDEKGKMSGIKDEKGGVEKLKDGIRKSRIRKFVWRKGGVTRKGNRRHE